MKELLVGKNLNIRLDQQYISSFPWERKATSTNDTKYLTDKILNIVARKQNFYELYV